MNLDASLTWYLRLAERDPDVLGFAVYGSHVFGEAHERSDYDVLCLLRDGASEHPTTRFSPTGQALEFWHVNGAELERLVREPGWWTFGFSNAQVMLDKTGALETALQRLEFMPEETARTAVSEGFDAYLNAFLRSIKAWRRNDEFGGRLHASDAVRYLIGALFALERRWTPYWDRLESQWAHLEPQGWQPNELRSALLEVLRSGNPKQQQALEAKVSELMKARGFSHVLEGWGHQLDAVRDGASS